MSTSLQVKINLIQIRSLCLLIFFCLAVVQTDKVWRSNFNWIVLKPTSFKIHVCISSMKYMSWFLKLKTKHFILYWMNPLEGIHFYILLGIIKIRSLTCCPLLICCSIKDLPCHYISIKRNKWEIWLLLDCTSDLPLLCSPYQDLHSIFVKYHPILGNMDTLLVYLYEFWLSR